MPQLNPSPWFFIMLASWLTYSTIIQSKVSLFISMNPPSSKTSTITSPAPWTWPWT